MTQRMAAVAALCLTIGVGAPKTSQADAELHHLAVVPDERFTDIRSMIEARVGDDIPSFGVSVLHKGEVLWEEAFGWADVENQVAATPATLYSIASVSKSITSTGVMLLAEKGEIDLDAPIGQYIASGIVTPLLESYRSPTVRELLTMMGGFPMGFMSVNDSRPAPERDELLLHHGGLQVFTPGEAFHYSNFSLGVAELVVEAATGRSFGDAMDEVLFTPAGMHATEYSSSRMDKGGVAVNYAANGTALPGRTSMPAGGAGSYSSISDLRRYASAHLGHSPDGSNSLISKASRDTMHIETSSASDGMFAAGWWSLDLGDSARLVVSDGHGTGMALVQLYPQEDIAVICVMSTRKDDPDGSALTNKVANQIFEILSPGFTAQYEKFFGDLAKSSTGNALPTSEFVGRWSGHVRLFNDSRMSLEMLVQPDGDIHVTLEDQYTVLLTEMRYRNGILEGWFPGLIPVSVDNDRVHDILGRFRFQGNQIQGYLNANFDDADGSYDLPNAVFLQRESGVPLSP